MSANLSLVASYANHGLARATVMKLQNAGFDTRKLFIVARDEDEPLAGAAAIRDLNSLGSEQISCIPGEDIPDYEAELRVDRVLLVTHGTPEEIAQARSIIDSTHPEGWNGNVGCAVYYGCRD